MHHVDFIMIEVSNDPWFNVDLRIIRHSLLAATLV